MGTEISAETEKGLAGGTGRVEFDVCELFAYELKNSENIILANRESGTHLIIRKGT